MDSLSQLGLIFVTTASESEARTIAKSLINARLAACITITPIESIYRWQGDIQSDSEYQLVIKSDLALFDQISDHVTQQHSYELPEIIAIPMTHSTQAYGRWVLAQVLSS